MSSLKSLSLSSVVAVAVAAAAVPPLSAADSDWPASGGDDEDCSAEDLHCWCHSELVHQRGMIVREDGDDDLQRKLMEEVVVVVALKKKKVVMIDEGDDHDFHQLQLQPAAQCPHFADDDWRKGWD